MDGERLGVSVGVSGGVPDLSVVRKGVAGWGGVTPTRIVSGSVVAIQWEFASLNVDIKGLFPHIK